MKYLKYICIHDIIQKCLSHLDKVDDNVVFMTKLLEEMSQAQEQLLKEKQLITG